MLLKFSGLLILGLIVLVLFSAAMLYAALLFFCWAIEALTKHDARKRARTFKAGVFLLLVVALLSGCAISNQGVFPKPVWYWSKAAQIQREHDAWERQRRIQTP